jgi:hypothetical protein
MEQWNIDQAVVFLTEARDRHAGDLEGTKLSVNNFDYRENVDKPSYNLGVVRSLNLSIEVVKNMADRTKPPERTLRDDVISITKTLRDSLSDMLDNLSWKIKYLENED